MIHGTSALQITQPHIKLLPASRKPYSYVHHGKHYAKLYSLVLFQAWLRHYYNWMQAQCLAESNGAQDGSVNEYTVIRPIQPIIDAYEQAFGFSLSELPHTTLKPLMMAVNHVRMSVNIHVRVQRRAIERKVQA